MGRNKLEQEFSQKLSTREINPSAAAWDRLDAMLSTAEVQKKPRRNYWFFIAAAVVGIALFATLFYPNGNDIKTVDAGSSAVAESESIPAEKASDPIEAPAVQMAEIAPAETAAPTSTNNRNQVNPRRQKQLLAVKENAQKAIESAQHEKPSVTEKPAIKNNGDISESLLASIKSKTEAQKTSVVKVDARSLLQNVDKDNELTTRQRFLKTVQNVKVAVENRNLEENH